MALPNLAELSLQPKKEETPVNASVSISTLNLPTNPQQRRAQVHDRAYQYFRQRFLSDAPDDNDTDIDYVHHLGEAWTTDGDTIYWNRILTYTDAQGNQQVAQVPANWANAGPNAIIRLTPLFPNQGDHMYFCSKVFLFTAWAMQRRDHPNANYPAAFKNPWTREPFVPPRILYDAFGNSINAQEINDMRTLRDDFLQECSGYWADPAQTIPLFNPQGGIPYGNNPFPAGAAWDPQQPGNLNDDDEATPSYDPLYVYGELQPTATLAQKRHALGAVVDIASGGADNVETLLRVGFVPRIVPLLAAINLHPTPEERQLQGLAADALEAMFKKHIEARQAAKNAGALTALRTMVVLYRDDSRSESAASALFFLINKDPEYVTNLFSQGPDLLTALRHMIDQASYTDANNAAHVDYSKARTVVRNLDVIASRNAARIHHHNFYPPLIALLSAEAGQPYGFAQLVAKVLAKLTGVPSSMGHLGNNFRVLLTRCAVIMQNRSRHITDAEEINEAQAIMEEIESILDNVISRRREQAAAVACPTLVPALMRAIPWYMDYEFVKLLEAMIERSPSARTQFMSFRSPTGGDGVGLLRIILQNDILTNSYSAAMIIRFLVTKQWQSNPEWSYRIASDERLLMGLLGTIYEDDDESRKVYLKALIDMSEDYDAEELNARVIREIYQAGEDPTDCLQVLSDVLRGTGSASLADTPPSTETKLLAAQLLGRIAQSVGMEAKTVMLQKDILAALVDLLKEESNNQRPAPRFSTATYALSAIARNYPAAANELRTLGVVPPYRAWRTRNL